MVAGHHHLPTKRNFTPSSDRPPFYFRGARTPAQSWLLASCQRPQPYPYRAPSSLLRAHPYLQGMPPKLQIGKARCLHSSAILAKDSSTALGPSSPNSHAHAHAHERAENRALSSETFTLFLFSTFGKRGLHTIHCIVYAGLGFMATVESTFWFHVLRAKLFPRTLQEAQQRHDELVRRLSEAVANIRRVCMANYKRDTTAPMGVGTRLSCTRRGPRGAVKRVARHGQNVM